MKKEEQQKQRAILTELAHSQLQRREDQPLYMVIYLHIRWLHQTATQPLSTWIAAKGKGKKKKLTCLTWSTNTCILLGEIEKKAGSVLPQKSNPHEQTASTEHLHSWHERPQAKETALHARRRNLIPEVNTLSSTLPGWSLTPKAILTHTSFQQLCSTEMLLPLSTPVSFKWDISYVVRILTLVAT